jgi:hypothetical protein
MRTITIRVEDDRKADALETLLEGMPDVTIKDEHPLWWDTGVLESYDTVYYTDFHIRNPPQLVHREKDGTCTVLKTFQ